MPRELVTKSNVCKPSCDMNKPMKIMKINVFAVWKKSSPTNAKTITVCQYTDKAS